MIAGVLSMAYSCAQTCTSGIASIAGQLTTTTCCQTDNCNIASLNTTYLEEGNVTSCYTGIITDSIGFVPAVACIFPMNFYCQVHSVYGFNC